MKNISKCLLGALLATVFLTSCTTKVEDYKSSSPTFLLEDYFSGDLVAWGMVQDYSAKVTRRFCVEMNGSWESTSKGLTGVLDEQFYYADGEQDRRVWTLTKQPNNRYVGRAGDVDGEASGQVSGFAFQWDYTLNLELEGSAYKFVLDDWMYQLDQYRLMNRTKMKKFGITVAEITIFFDKETPLRDCSTFSNH
jgi:hypothetical protein